MKLWEAIKKVEEEGKEFVSIYDLKLYKNGPCFVFEAPSINSKYVISTTRDWQEVKKTVGWNEALEHMKKSPKNHANLGIMTYRMSSDGYLEILIVDNDWEPAYLRTEMLDSKEWELL